MQSGTCRPGSSVDELSLVGGEEALGYCIVPALALFSRPTTRRPFAGPTRRSPGSCIDRTQPVGVKDDTGAGCRFTKAIVRASSMSLVRMWSASDQPTTFRLAKSMTVAK